MSGKADDDASQSPPPRPSPRNRKPEPIVIQAKAYEDNAFDARATARSGARELFSAGALGGAVGAALALAGVWVWAPRAEVAPPSALALAAPDGARLSALESGAVAAASERRGLGARLAAAEAALSDAGAKLAERVAALESVRASAEAERKAAADAARDLNASVGQLQRDLAAERNGAAADRQSLADDGARVGRAADALQSLERRLAALEGAAVRPEALAPVAADARAALDAAAKALAAAAAPRDDPRWASLAAELAKWAQQIAAQTVEIGGLRARLDKIEAASPVTLSNAPSAAADGAARRAVAALALLRRLDAGEPLAAELAALEAAGAPPPALAPLRRYAEAGAPSPAALARAFAALAPQWLAAERPAAPGEVARTVLAEIQGLVKVRKAGDIRESDAKTIASRVADALSAGDLAGALGAVGEMPPAAQAGAREWRDSVAARLAADRAAEALVARAVADLGDGR
jgi:hypothetical protein